MTHSLAPAAIPAAAQRQLRTVTVVFAIALLVHGSDHLRRGMDTVSSTVMVLGTVQLILAAATIVLIFRNHRWAIPAAIGIGFASAAGFILVHLFPDWFGPFSDSFINAPASAKVNGISWFAAIFEIISDFALGVTALRVRRLSGRGQYA
ncbi:hypothetical protein OHB26_26815 [Nocardia sp. NBC_01503]|uniref:hypothetical protein n=1 Tax=Nocardia sp. NBC_01503 TaxID=2975997 RepID=UPI002E7ABFAF|nr:hypothetical protein [Nocardia sp. NBC_01503]WTL30525.1 hypothetical protein OHB26_26815 [Nocardia sp. NBC_01503]